MFNGMISICSLQKENAEMKSYFKEVIFLTYTYLNIFCIVNDLSINLFLVIPASYIN